MAMTKSQTAWVAGLLEADGCFTISHHRGCVVARVQCHMTDKDVLDKLASVVGHGNVLGPIKISDTSRERYSQLGTKPMYYWCVMKREVVDQLLEALLPWMGERRSLRIVELQAAQLTRRGRGEDMTHCKNGHEFTEENTYRWKGTGSRACRKCRNYKMKIINAARSSKTKS